jgi:hypothetical protein
MTDILTQISSVRASKKLAVKTGMDQMNQGKLLLALRYKALMYDSGLQSKQCMLHRVG